MMALGLTATLHTRDNIIILITKEKKKKLIAISGTGNVCGERPAVIVDAVAASHAHILSLAFS